MRKLYLLFLLSLFILSSAAGTLDDIRRALEESSSRQVQEKVYIHTDNTCYFVGDTLWYKAYVVRADDLRYTNLSRILYVELLSPDGLVVERQRVIVSDRGLGNGCFCLRDSLYSGYYELRAYTRWMLNFNVSWQRYSRNDADLFYNRAMARDYFRVWDGLFSRAIPIYGKPDEPGDYTYKRMYRRPKQNIAKAAKAGLRAAFYPEGGTLVAGVPCRVAFELTDQEGAAVNAVGTVTADGDVVAEARTVHLGRGAFTVTPGARRLRASFTWRDKEWTFDLPEAQAAGATLRCDGGSVDIAARGLSADADYGLSVLCRGALRHFQTVRLDASGNATVELPDSLPTGVNDVTLFDASGRILADRLFFVNNHDYDTGTITAEGDPKTTYSPYDRIDLALNCDTPGRPFLCSVAVRDARTDEPTYDDGDIMTDLLLGSELRGFIASPAYYFADGGRERTEALDLLMMVQGWRKYKWQELADTACMVKRYAPERTMTIEGGVYKMLSLNDVEPTEIESWRKGVGYTARKTEDDTAQETVTADGDDTGDDAFITTDDITVAGTQSDVSSIEYGSIGDANVSLGVNHGALKREVMVEAEISFGDEVVGAAQITRNGGRYVFEVPPYYGDAILNMKAYDVKDSLTKSMASMKDRRALDEDAYPDYFVKRDLFYPVFTHKYSYYQNHAPEDMIPLFGEADDDSLLLSMERDVHHLGNVDVKGRRRGKRAIDFNKPAYVADAYALYNDITDYGLSYGKLDMRQFPVQVARFLYGNMNRYNRFNVDGRIDRFTYYRNYQPDANNPNKNWDNRNALALYNTLKLKRLSEVRVFSDYEPRDAGADMEQSRLNADVTVELMPFPNDAKQPTFRDRHYVLHGFNEPVAFYCPDYSEARPDAPGDYRRTLYWNPNAVIGADGRFTATFYNNGRETRIKVSAAGITPDGRLVRVKTE